MPGTDRQARSLAVRISPAVRSEEIGRLREGSLGRVAADRELSRLERDGIEIGQLLRCQARGPDGTRLGAQFKAYVPISDRPASQRPFGFVFEVGRDGNTPFLSIVAFGERHPRPGTRSVYERAHKRLEGRYPDQERPRPGAARVVHQVRSPSRPLARGRQPGLER